MFYLLVLLSFLSFSVQAMEQEQSISLWALHNVIVRPKDNIPLLPTFLTPKILEKDLIDAARNNTSYTNTQAAQHHGELPVGFKAWLLDLASGEELQKIALKEKDSIAQQKSWCTRTIFNLAFPIVIKNAFTPKESVSYLQPIPKIIALVQACQQHGCQTALASNRNSADFTEIEKQLPSVVNLFEQRFTSGKPDTAITQPKKLTKLQLLTSEPAFFEKIRDTMGGGRSYYYIDIEEGKESLDAAREAGVTPISVIDANDKEKANDLKSKLIKHGLITE